MSKNTITKERTQEIIKLHNQLQTHLHISVSQAIEIGRLLVEQKNTLLHGSFTKWIKENLPFTDRTARNYIKLYQQRVKTETLSSLNQAYKLLRMPVYELHELAKLFPPMSPEEYESFKKSIKEYGLFTSITLYQGKILDGKERYRACLEVGVSPHFKEYLGNDPLDYILQENLYRQHLKKDQKLIIALELEKSIKESRK